jgi:antirestriction protein ArdC
MKQSKPKLDIRKAITESFTGQIQDIIDGKRVSRFSMPWINGTGPIKADGSSYRGMNVFWLGLQQEEKGYSSNQWFGFGGAKEAAYTFAKSQGRNIVQRERKKSAGFYYWDLDNDCMFAGGVRKGETATPIVFYKKITVDDKASLEPGATVTIPMLKYLSVFNRDQLEGLPPVEVQRTFDISDRAQDIIDGFELPIMHGGDRAYYSPSKDELHLPNREQFKSDALYYSTAFHELGHSTGHSSRLDRLKRASFGSPEYAFEELVAELTSAYMCAHSGIEGNIQHVDYLASWLKVLKNDTGMIIKAASAAQKAADYIIEGEAVALPLAA